MNIPKTNKRYKTVIIDDEILARDRLKRLLKAHTDVFEVIGEAQNGQEGQQVVDTLKPDLIFLDIEMPLLNGFEMLRRLHHLPVVIFATAYDQYAIQAFEENSIDYLLKPILPERLERSIQKLHRFEAESTAGEQHVQSIQQLLQQLQPAKAITGIPIQVGDTIRLVPLTHVTHFEADGKYVYLHTPDQNKHLVDYTLTTLDDKLPEQFVRVHKSYIVNSEFIKQFEKYFRGRYILHLNDKEGTKVTSGASFSDRVKGLFEL
ncbi:LytTR family transcriptional regulator DNA-binding domain-containing protein [uncultured Microscilla sp.]|uniref:LytR/AlgR family response regulator transcription factor n=1 Tax=uncultured Microscilla sp. TaxID=432653 RepID=UPI00263602B2|nr:LytTR family transcriptional regulator DNA-binding domain-containing protein [uncultured Microscilla sp.]